MLPKVMNKCILLHTPYLQNEKTKDMYNTNREFHKHFGKKQMFTEENIFYKKMIAQSTAKKHAIMEYNNLCSAIV